MIGASTEDDVFRKARSLAVVRAAARSLWLGHAAVAETRAAARRRSLTGRGIAYTYRSNTIVAVIAEVEVNRETGRVWAKRLVCAHDCGLVINPKACGTPSSAACCTA